MEKENEFKLERYQIPDIKSGLIFQIIRTCQKLQRELREYTLPTIEEDIQHLENIINQSYDFLGRIEYYKNERMKINERDTEKSSSERI